MWMWILNLYSAISWSISIALSTLVFREKYSLQTTPKFKLLLQSDGSRRLSGSEFQAIGPPTGRRPDGRMYFVETAEQLGSDDWQISDAIDWRHPRLGCRLRCPCFEGTGGQSPPASSVSELRSFNNGTSKAVLDLLETMYFRRL